MKDVYVYYDFPIIFSAVNKEGDIFICLFAEEADSHLRYICVKVSPVILFELENNQKDVRMVFEHSERVFSILLNAQSEEPIEVSGELEDITPFLPDEGLFIGESHEEISQLVKFNISLLMNSVNCNFISTPPDYVVDISPYSKGNDIFSGDFSWLTAAA
jgi:hypothetical protein